MSKNNSKSAAPLSDTVKVWEFLEKVGGIDPVNYDDGLMSDVRKSLGFPHDDDFVSLLSSRSITIDQLIISFFSAAQPFAYMMSELLGMFQRAGATHAKHNLQVKFDFSNDSSQLSFDLEHFRSTLATWKKVSGVWLERQWTLALLVELLNAIGGNGQAQKRIPSQNAIGDWIEKYKLEGKFPGPYPPKPLSGIPLLDERIDVVWDLWKTMVKLCEPFDSEHHLPDRGAANYVERPKHEEEQGFDHWPLGEIRILKTNNWPVNFALALDGLVLRLNSLTPADRLAQARDCVADIDRVLAKVPRSEVRGERLRKELEDFLNLPVWKHRYNLYSAWMLTQIFEAVGNDLQIHHQDGKMEFGFKGTHFATSEAFDPRLHVWAEVRSPVEKTTSKGRKNNIQPDYRLILDPISQIESTILAVECKQYLKASGSNFRSALKDYALGCPKAFVILVNYGEAKQSILGDITEPEILSRIALIGNMRPQSDPEESIPNSSQIKFRDLVQAQLTKQTKAIPTSYPAWSGYGVGQGTPLVARLQWDVPADLDLLLKIQTTKDTFEVNFSDKGSMDGMPYAWLDIDRREAGTENIIVSHFLDGDYYLVVHKYSGEAPLNLSRASVTLTGHFEHQFTCPSSGDGDYWIVCRISPSTNKVHTINTIEDRRPW